MNFLIRQSTTGSGADDVVRWGLAKAEKAYCIKLQFCIIFKKIVLYTRYKCVVERIVNRIKQLMRELKEQLRHNDVIQPEIDKNTWRVK